MKDVEFTKLSSKGQVVIPADIRGELRLESGTPFAVSVQDSTILLKKVELPEIKSWDEVTKPFRDAARKARFTEAELDILISEVRAVGK